MFGSLSARLLAAAVEADCSHYAAQPCVQGAKHLIANIDGLSPEQCGSLRLLARPATAVLLPESSRVHRPDNANRAMSTARAALQFKNTTDEAHARTTSR